MSNIITLKRKEAKTIRFTVTSDGVAADVSTATLSFQIKSDKDGDALVSKADGDFDKTDAATGVVTVPLSATNLDLTPGKYYGELRTTFSASNIDKSGDITIKIEKAVHS
jgi:hypothetical protein